MALQLPARASFPDGRAGDIAVVGDPHVEEDTKNVVEGQHFEMAYYGRRLIPCQRWASGDIQVSNGAGMTRILVWDDLPRIAMQDIEWRFRATAVANAGTVRVRFPDLPINVDTAVAVGTAYYTDNSTALGPINRADTVTQIELWINDGGAGGDSITVLEFGLWDKDLTLAQLP
tara:strand:+ start:484 stop:1005 length:522 start_codon:yes stop_codon:yes gene_type:complete